MATGDLHNNLRKLLRELKNIRYPCMSQLDLRAMTLGTPNTFLPILHYVFLDYSCQLSQFLSNRDYDLYGKSDLRFVETVYRVLRDEFHYKPPLTREQFLALGFAERKVIQLCEILKKCRIMHDELNPKSSKDKKKSSADKKGVKKSSLEKATVKSTDYHPLPVNTEMISYHSNQDAIRCGGFSEPLVKRLAPDDHTSDGNKENFSGNSTQQRGITSNLVQRATTERATNITGPVNLQQSGQVLKTVRWDDSNIAKSDHQECNSTQTQEFPQSYFPDSRRLSDKIYGTTIPAPVAMTTAPKPSPDLMLTPVGKVRHEMIPLSASHDYQNKGGDVSLIDLTDSTVVQQPKIIRHSLDVSEKLAAYQERGKNASLALTEPSASNSNELLEQQLKGMEEKYSTVLSQNNQMSARIVLLENRMKMLEELADKKTCNCTCSNEQSLKRITSGTSSVPISQAKFTYLSGNGSVIETSFPRSSEIHQESPTRRSLFTNADSAATKKFLDQYSTNSNRDETEDDRQHLLTQGMLSTVTEASENDTSVSTESVVSPVLSPVHGNRIQENTEGNMPSAMGSALSTTGYTINTMGTPTRVIGEAYSVGSTPDIHLTFADPSTKATVMNVHRRLKETREMLARTNQNYAAKFTHHT